MQSRFIRRVAAVVLGLASALASAAPTVMTFNIAVQTTSDQAVNYSFGFAQAFAASGGYDLKFSLAGAYADGARGKVGEVKLSAIAVKDFAAPSAFTFNFSSPFAGGRVTSRGAVAGARADGGTDGVSMGPIAGQNPADFGLRRSDDTDTFFGVNDSDNTLGKHGPRLDVMGRR